MKTLQSHNEEMEKKFNGEFEMEETVSIGKADKKALETTFEKAKSFITNSNKQLYIKIAEEELKRLTTELEIQYRVQEKAKEVVVIGRARVSGMVADKYTRIGRMEVLKDSIQNWTNILQELNK